MHGLADQFRSGESLSVGKFADLPVELSAEPGNDHSALAAFFEWCTASHEQITFAR